MVDIDKNELNKKRGLNIDLKINQDVKIFLNKISTSLNYKISKKEWLKKCYDWKIKYPIVDKNILKKKICKSIYFY